MNLVDRIIDGIVNDLADRGGFGDVWDNLDWDDQDKIIKSWKRIVYNELQITFNEIVGV